MTIRTSESRPGPRCSKRSIGLTTGSTSRHGTSLWAHGDDRVVGTRGRPALLPPTIIRAASEHNLRVAIEQTGASRENELDALLLSRNRLYDGLIVSTVGFGPADIGLLKVDYPVVILGERFVDGPVDHVAMPNVEGACAATSHLIEHGCRRIVMVDGPVSDEVAVSELRLTGYRQALGQSGIVFDPSLVVNIEELTMQSGADVARALVAGRRRFDGVFCVTDTVAIGVLRGLADAGVRVPSRVRVIGFDNLEESAFTVPSLSSIDPDHESMARTAVSLLVRRIEAGAPGRPRRAFVSQFSVVARESTRS